MPKMSSGRNARFASISAKPNICVCMTVPALPIRTMPLNPFAVANVAIASSSPGTPAAVTMPGVAAKASPAPVPIRSSRRPMAEENVVMVTPSVGECGC